MRLWFILLGLLLPFAVSCATPTAQQRAERREARAERKAEQAQAPPLLWEVKGDRGTLFLFGTMHFGVAADDLPSIVQQTLATCDVFVLESDPGAADQQRLADLMMLPQGSPGLDERLGPQRWTKLLTMLDGAFEERVAKRLQPWVIEAVVIRDLMPTEQAMESALLVEAQKRQMPVQYLEDWQTQIELLNRVTTVDVLAEIVDDPAGFRQRTQQMSADYARGDLEALERHIFGAEYAAEEALFESRNRAWMPRLDQLAGSNRAFVAVGAGHLIGPDSMLQMLRERGYELRRLQ